MQRLLEACGYELAQQCNQMCGKAEPDHPFYKASHAKTGHSKAVVFISTKHNGGFRDQMKHRTMTKMLRKNRKKRSDLHGIT